MKKFTWRKGACLLVAALFLFNHVRGQTYYASTPSELYQLDLANGQCNSTLIGPLVVAGAGTPLFGADIALCPDGSLYITDNFNIWQIDPTTAEGTLAAGDGTYTGIVGLVCAGGGILYGASPNFAGGDLFVIDVNSGTITNLGPIGFNCTGDLVFYNGVLYMTAFEGLVQINISDPPSSSLVYPLTNADYVGLTVYDEECNTLLGGDPSGNLTLINLDDGSETPLCTYPAASGGGLTGTPEFGPPAACPVVLDLDGDDSTNAPPYDYIGPIYNCNTTNGSRVADLDALADAPGAISQMIVSIAAGIQNGAFEFLELASANNIQIGGSGTSTIILTNQGNASLNDFENALEAIRYQNLAQPLGPGIREITASFLTVNGQQSNDATAFIEVIQDPEVPVDLGPDVEICPGESVLLDAGSAGTAYLWSTLATTSSITVNSPGAYSVTVTDGINCPGRDTVNVVFSPLVAVQLLGPSQICEGENANLFLSGSLPGPVNVIISDDNGNSDFFPNVNSGVPLPVQINETTTFLLDTIWITGIKVCFEIVNGGWTMEVIPETTNSTEVSLCEGDSIFLEGSWQTEAGVYQDAFTSVQGCDSIVITTVLSVPSDTVFLSASSCDPAQVGTDTLLLTNQSGCDSVLITTTTLVGNDTTLIQAASCNPQDTGTVVEVFSGSVCDSVVITSTSLLPTDTSLLSATSCDPAQVGTDTLLLSNQSGCDSVLITTTTLVGNDTTLIQAASCNPQDTGTVVEVFSGSVCDSVVITSTSLLPTDTSLLSATSCDPAQVGTDTLLLTNQSGCDSVLITTTTLVGNDTTLIQAASCNPQDTGTVVEVFSGSVCDSVVITSTSLLPTDTSLLSATSCDPAQVGTDTLLLTNQSGCDSVLITTTTLVGNDTTLIQAASCNPQDTGTVVEVFSGSVCDSVVITSTSLLPTDTSLLSATSCDPAQVGTDTLLLTNQSGCDSVLITTTTLVGNDTTLIQTASCNPQDTGTVVEVFSGSVCDSVVITSTSLLPTDTSLLSATSCDPAQVGTDTLLLSNQSGCDSVLITTTTLVGNDTTLIQAASCNPQDTGTVVEVFSGSVCDSVVITSTSLLPTDTSLLSATSCDPAQVGTDTLLLTNQSGCDSVLITTIFLLPEDSCGFGEIDIFIPNVFSPNGDGYNDVFLISAGQEVINISRMLIFNRWGGEIFVGENLRPNVYQDGWDGTFQGQLLNPGVFVYYLEVELLDGKIRSFKGSITLVR